MKRVNQLNRLDCRVYYPELGKFQDFLRKRVVYIVVLILGLILTILRFLREYF
jgi:hypothetical protein